MGNNNSINPNLPKPRVDNKWTQEGNEGEQAPSLPLPTPPDSSKAEIFSSQLSEDIDKHAILVTDMRLLNSTFEELAYNITNTCATDVDRTRAIFTWLTNINPAVLVKGTSPRKGSPLEYLQLIDSRKGNKAYMYSHICLAAGVPCVLITGINKSSAYKIGSTIVKEELAAQWNAVLINDQWRLVDTFWGSVSTSKNVSKDWRLLDNATENDNTVAELEPEEELTHNDFFFLTDPKKLISTHLPNDKQWQMLNDPIDIQMFEKQAFLRDRFFDMDAQIIDNHLLYCISETKSGIIDIVFGIPAINAQYLQFKYSIYQERGQVPPENYSLQKYVLYQKKAETVKFTVQFPVGGRFKVDIFGMHEVEDTKMELMASYIVDALASKDAQPLPDEPDIGWGAGAAMEKKGLEADNDDAIIETKDGCVELRFHKSNPLSVLQAMRHNNMEDWLLQRVSVIWEDGDDVVVTIRLPEPGQYAFKLYADDPNSEGELDNICNYLLKSVNQNTTPNLFPKLYNWVLGKGRYAEELGVQADSNPESHIKTDDGKLRLVFMNQPDTELMLQLTCNKFEDELLAKSIIRIEEDGQTIFEINLPDAGEYGINIYGKSKTSQSAAIHHAHSCLVESTQCQKRVTSAEIIQEQKKDENTEIETFRKLEKVPLPEGPFEYPLVGSLQRQQAQDPMDESALSESKDSNENVMMAKLPELGKYDLDIFEIQENGSLMSVAAVVITRRRARPGEAEVDEKPRVTAPDTEMKRRQEIEALYAPELHKLRLAVKVLDDNGIESALNYIKERGEIPEELNEEVTKAFNLMTQYRKHSGALKSAMDKGSVEQLERALNALQKAGPAIRSKLAAEMRRALDRLDRLRRLEKFRHAILKLKKTTLAEIRAYATPPAPVYSVMGATFLILGETETIAKDWTQIRALIGKTGKTNLLRRIQLYDVNSMTEQTLTKSRNMMQGIDMGTIREVSVGAATFFVWVTGMLETAQENLLASQ